MSEIKWEDAKENDLGIYTIAFKEKYIKSYYDIVGYNGILKGDAVMYNGKKYNVVMVSRLGDFGLSETGELPYILRVPPTECILL